FSSPSPTATSPPSLHDALPISGYLVDRLDHHIAYEVAPDAPVRSLIGSFAIDGPELPVDPRPATVLAPPLRGDGWLANNGCCARSEEHTSELQSQSNLVCRLLL